MNKTILTALALAVLLTPGVMAKGNSEKTETEETRERYGRPFSFDREQVELEGTLILDSNFFPSLNVKGEKWVLMVHGIDTDEIKLEDGMTLKVNGFEMPARRQGKFLNEEEKAIHVTSAVIDGTEYTFEEPGHRDRGMMGRDGKRNFGPEGQNFNNQDGFKRGPQGDDSAIQELKKLFAKGEITEEEYRERLEVLREDMPSRAK